MKESKRYLIVGLGKTGLATCNHLIAQGVLPENIAFVTVETGSFSECEDELQSSGHTIFHGAQELRGQYDVAITSPGISVFSKLFQAAQNHACEIMGEPEFAWRQSPQRWIGVTGTNGKTTTTTLITALLNASHIAAVSAGNIGNPLIAEVSERKDAWIVAELSSYQLATAQELHPRVGVLTNLDDDHLAWHKTAEHYRSSKARLFAHLSDSDLAVVGVDDPYSADLAHDMAREGKRVCMVSTSSIPDAQERAYVDGAGHLTVELGSNSVSLCATSELAMKGEHNVQNALLASAAALFVGAERDLVVSQLKRFTSLAHRTEYVGSIDDVVYIDDSKATNPAATIQALKAQPKGATILLLGGKDKQSDLHDLARMVAHRAKHTIVFGEAAEHIAKALHTAGAPTELVPRMSDAFARACELAQPQDVVLLSPACASFDEFSSFEERGDAFKQLVYAVQTKRAHHG